MCPWTLPLAQAGVWRPPWHHPGSPGWTERGQMQNCDPAGWAGAGLGPLCPGGRHSLCRRSVLRPQDPDTRARGKQQRFPDQHRPAVTPGAGCAPGLQSQLCQLAEWPWEPRCLLLSQRPVLTPLHGRTGGFQTHKGEGASPQRGEPPSFSWLLCPKPRGLLAHLHFLTQHCL